MAESVPDEKTPLMQDTDDGDDVGAAPTVAAPTGGNVSMGFTPGEPRAKSTPAPRQTKLNTAGELPSFDELPDTPGLSTTKFAEDQLEKLYPKYDKTKIFVSAENDKLKIKLIGSKKNPESLFIYDSDAKKYRLNGNIARSSVFKQALGSSRLDTLPVEIEKLTDAISVNKQMADDKSLNDTEREKAHTRALMEIAKRNDLQKQLVALQNGMGNTSTYIEMDTFNENEAARQQRGKEIQAEIEVQETVLNAEDSAPEEKARAAEKKRELEQEVNEIENEREGEITQLRLRDRIREKVKAIFKKYGFTVTGVLLAVGTTIGVVLSSLSNGLKSLANRVGNGFKAFGKQLAKLLPGLLGAVVSFVFRTAGQVISFLGKHAWLLILAVAAFLFERLIKKKRD